MATYVCPNCHEEGPLFQGIEVTELAERKGINYLGKIPFDPEMSAASISGTPYFLKNKESPAGKAISAVADQIINTVNKNN